MREIPRPRLNLRIGIIFIATFALILILLVQFLTRSSTEIIPLTEPETATAGPAAAPSPTASVQPMTIVQNSVYIHVVGEVKKPGVVEVPEGTRISEVIAQAGGFTSDAAQQSVNLAQLAQDGSQLVIPTQDEFTANTSATEQYAGATQAEPGDPKPTTVNINTATETELIELHGIGPATAQKIIDFRTEHGPFNSVEDLLSVNGIGPATLEKFRDDVSVS